MWVTRLTLFIFVVSASPTIRKSQRHWKVTDYKNAYYPSSRMKRNPLIPKLPNLTNIDDGDTYGNVVIVNDCGKTLYLRSVGAWYYGGADKTKTDEDEHTIIIPPNGNHREPYRTTCFSHGIPKYCESDDKLGGQGVSVKIAASNESWSNIAQVEYSLVKNTDRGDNFKRLNYDVSLLNCGMPETGFPGDANATLAQHQLKVNDCPGYEGGVSVIFDGDPDSTNCIPVHCDGKQRCPLIYVWDKTRPKEASIECEREYRGDMRVELCATRGKNLQKDVSAFKSYTATASHELLDLLREAPSYGPEPPPSPPILQTFSIATPPPSGVKPTNIPGLLLPPEQTTYSTTITTRTLTITGTGTDRPMLSRSNTAPPGIPKPLESRIGPSPQTYTSHSLSTPGSRFSSGPAPITTLKSPAGFNWPSSQTSAISKPRDAKTQLPPSPLAIPYSNPYPLKITSKVEVTQILTTRVTRSSLSSNSIYVPVTAASESVPPRPASPRSTPTDVTPSTAVINVPVSINGSYSPSISNSFSLISLPTSYNLASSGDLNVSSASLSTSSPASMVIVTITPTAPPATSTIYSVVVLPTSTPLTPIVTLYTTVRFFGSSR